MMNRQWQIQSWWNLLSGALAGVISTLVFTIIHDIFISDIWSMLAPMLVAGAVCGLCLSWCYNLMVPTPSVGSWLRFNLLFVGMFFLLGATSVLVFEPVTTMAAVVMANEPPDDLIRQSLPMTAAFTLGMAVLVSALYGRSWLRFGVSLLSCTLLVLLLGLNVSAVGLVAIPGGSLYVIAELFGLIVALNGAYVLVYCAIEWRRLLSANVTAPETSAGRSG